MLKRVESKPKGDKSDGCQTPSSIALNEVSELRADFARARSRVLRVGKCKDLSHADCVQLLNSLLQETNALHNEVKGLLHRAIYSSPAT